MSWSPLEPVMKGSNLKTRKIGWHSTLEFQEGAVQVRQKQRCLELCSDPDSKETL